MSKDLVAENPRHLKQIIHKYVQENETKIYQSSNPRFSGWVEIVDNQDSNVYLYVGEKNGSNGQVKIRIFKDKFYSQPYHNFYAKESGGTYSHKEMLKLAWNLFTINRPKTPTEEREYYSHNGGLELEWQRNWPHRHQQGLLCWNYLRGLQKRLNRRLEYWKKEPNSLKGADMPLTITTNYIEAIDHELATIKKIRPAYYDACNKDCHICGVTLCCHYENQACSENKKMWNPNKAQIIDRNQQK